MNTEDRLTKHLSVPYDELERLNLEAKARVQQRMGQADLAEYYSSYLANENSIKAITLCFSDIEGRFHMLDYDKKFFLKNTQNLTFDGSSIHGFSEVNHSDLRIEPDWGSFRWLPADIFGSGKVIMFALIRDQDGSSYSSDFRTRLKDHIEKLYTEHGLTTNIAVECEGFLLHGRNAEQEYGNTRSFDLVSYGGYFNSLPQNPLRQFIDSFADAQRAMGFENEKDHPEVAPSQFELNYRYTDALTAADQLQLYKLLARQIAANKGMTASFLPKPVAGINGSGMHCNISLSHAGRNTFFDAAKEDNLSSDARDFVERLLYSANDLSLILNPSVNAYRRQDPEYEAPNQIKSSATDRTSMVRIPLGNENSARIEVRTVAPDSNPYLVFYSLLRTGREGAFEKFDESKRPRTRFLPTHIQDAIKHFKSSEMLTRLLGPDAKDKYLGCKTAAANRCPRELGKKVKVEEILFHHEVTNQYLWAQF